jgi:hypothetical protein
MVDSSTDQRQEIVQRDKQLTAAVKAAEKKVRTAQLKLDLHRYAWTAHPDTPESLRLTQKAYADLVGISQQAISQSVVAVEKSIAAEHIQLDVLWHPSEEEPEEEPDEPEVTEEQAEQHATSRIQAKFGEEKALIIEALATAFDATPGTVGANNQVHWKDRIARCTARTQEIVTAAGRSWVEESDAQQAAEEIKAEFDRFQRRLKRIRRKMTEHRQGLNIRVTNTMVKDLYKRAVRYADRQGIRLDNAINDRLEWDRKETAVKRDEAERAAQRNRYVMDIEQGLSSMVHGGVQVEKAMKAAKGELNLTDDELADFSQLLAKIKAALSIIDLLIGGNADWDTALKELSNELG